MKSKPCPGIPLLPIAFLTLRVRDGLSVVTAAGSQIAEIPSLQADHPDAQV